MVFNARVKINWKLLLRLFLRKSWRSSFCLHSGLNKNYFTRTYPWFFDAAYRTRDTQAEKNAILPVFFFFFFVYFSFGLSVYGITGFRRVHVIIPHKLVKIRQGCFIYLTYRKSYNIELEFSYRNYYVPNYQTYSLSFLNKSYFLITYRYLTRLHF